MTVFVHKTLWFIFHRNALLLLAVYRTLVYRVRFSIRTTAVNGGMEGIVIDFLIREAGDLLRYSSSEDEKYVIRNAPTRIIHVNTITLGLNVNVG